MLVIGDIILDEYLIGEVSRISPEAPIPILNLRQDLARAGAAAYVAGHVQHFGGEARLCGVVGDDANGERVRGILREARVSAAGLVTDPSRPTIVKTRVIARRQQMVRIDREEIRPLSARHAAHLLGRVEEAIRGVDAVICSDYDKGTFTPELIRRAIGAARSKGVPVAVNPKPRLVLNFRGATVVSMNREEAAACLKRSFAGPDELRRAGAELRRRLGCKALLVTRHQEGMTVFLKSAAVPIASRAREVFDGTGAGDTVIAAVAMGLASRGGLLDSVHLANIAAGIEVGKLGCAYVSPGDIRAEL